MIWWIFIDEKYVMCYRIIRVVLACLDSSVFDVSSKLNS